MGLEGIRVYFPYTFYTHGLTYTSRKNMLYNDACRDSRADRYKGVSSGQPGKFYQ